jgi:hypothetical protein
MPAYVRLLDRADEHVCWLEASEARRLIARGQVEVLRTRRRIRAVRWVAAEAREEPRRLYVLRRRGYGDSHRRETWDNPRGVWTIDRIPRRHRTLFLTTIAERIAA